MQDEFCYLNKFDHSYDWRIVEFDKRNEKEYMTISARVLMGWCWEKEKYRWWGEVD